MDFLNKKFKGGVLLVSLVSSHLCWPQNVSSTSNVDVTDKRVSAAMETGFSSNMFSPNSPSYEASIDINMRLGFQRTRTHRIGVSSGLSQTVQPEKTFSMAQDFSISQRFGSYKLNDAMAFSLGQGIVLPATKKSLKQDSLIAGLSVTPSLSIKPDFQPLKGLGFSLSSTLRKNFHEFRQSRTGNPNTSMLFVQSFGGQLGITDSLSLSAGTALISVLSYENNINSIFRVSETLSLGVTDAMSLSLGHSNAGSTLSAAGLNNNFSIYDPNSSVWFTSISTSF